MQTAQADAVKAADANIRQQLALLEEQRTAMTPAFQDARGKVGALIYPVRNCAGSRTKSGQDSRQKDLERSEGGNPRSAMADWRRQDRSQEIEI